MIGSLSFGRALGILLVLDAALLLGVLGRTALSRVDEGQIAEVAREMVESGDWVTPRIGGTPFAPYPPLTYWLFAVSGAAIGFNEFAMRLPTALASLGLVAIVATLVRRKAGPVAGIASGGILVTFPAFFIQSGVCRADILTTLFAVAALDRFLAWAEGEKYRRDLALMYVFAALGILTKGPVAVAVLGLGGLAWFLLHKEWKLLLAMRFWIGIPAAILIVVPWYWAIYRLHGWDFLHENLFMENLNAFGEGYVQKRPWYFYLKQIPLLLPWALLLALSWKVRKSPGVAFSLAWLGLVALFFTISAAKRINYLAYFCPAAAMAVGTTLAALRTDAPRLVRDGLLGFCGIMAAGAVAMALLPGSVWTGENVLKVAPRFAAIGTAVVCVAAVVAALAWRKGPDAGSLGLTAILAGAYFLYGFFVNPMLNEESRRTADFCRRAATRSPEGEKIYSLHPEGVQGVVHFYSGAPLTKRRGEPGLYLVEQPQHERLVREGKRVEILDSMLDQRGRFRYLLRVHP